MVKFFAPYPVVTVEHTMIILSLSYLDYFVLHNYNEIFWILHNFIFYFDFLIYLFFKVIFLYKYTFCKIVNNVFTNIS